MQFVCAVCQVEFEHEGIKKEYVDPIYGPCAKTVAPCPECEAESTEYRPPKPQKANKSSDNGICSSERGPGCASCQFN